MCTENDCNVLSNCELQKKHVCSDHETSRKASRQDAKTTGCTTGNKWMHSAIVHLLAIAVELLTLQLFITVTCLCVYDYGLSSDPKKHEKEYYLLKANIYFCKK